MAVVFRCTVVALDRVECSIVWLEADAARRVSSTVYDLGGHRVTLYGGGEGEPSLPAPPAGAVRFVAMSDTHTQHRQLPRVPGGDVLLHTGDFTNTGTLEEVQGFAAWLATMPHAHKLIVPGNHDLSCDAEWYMSHWRDWHDECQSPAEAARVLSDAGVQILDGTSVAIGGVLVYGSPVQPRMPKQRTQMAFGRARGKELKAEWERLPVWACCSRTRRPLESSTRSAASSLAARSYCVQPRQSSRRCTALATTRVTGHSRAGARSL